MVLRSASCLSRRLGSSIPAGSRPLVGSSRTRVRGSRASAIAVPRRCFMPREQSRAPLVEVVVQSDGLHSPFHPASWQPAGHGTGTAEHRPTGTAGRGRGDQPVTRPAAGDTGWSMHWPGRCSDARTRHGPVSRHYHSQATQESWQNGSATVVPGSGRASPGS